MREGQEMTVAKRAKGTEWQMARTLELEAHDPRDAVWERISVQRRQYVLYRIVLARGRTIGGWKPLSDHRRYTMPNCR